MWRSKEAPAVSPGPKPGRAVFSSLLNTLLLSSSQKLAKDAIDGSIAEDIKFFAKVLFFSCLALGLDSDVIIINT